MNILRMRLAVCGMGLKSSGVWDPNTCTWLALGKVGKITLFIVVKVGNGCPISEAWAYDKSHAIKKKIIYLQLLYILSVHQLRELEIRLERCPSFLV